MKNGIYFYKHRSGKIAEFPTKETDFFGCVTFVFDQKEGFLHSKEEKCLLKSA